MGEPSDNGGLFGQASSSAAPLPARMRPRSLDEMIGQHELVGPDSMLRQAIEQDRLPSILLVGPAGCGKSTLARLIASSTSKIFVELSAVSSGVADIRKVANSASEVRGFHDRGTILFLDEIHRLSKNQQDALLPHVEAGTFTLIGATTENPYYTIIAPLRSRCQLYVLEALAPEDMATLVLRALNDEERGLGKLEMTIDDDALSHLVTACQGDARAALNTLELAAQTQAARVMTVLDLEAVEEALQRPMLHYDRTGDEHYDTISAFIKSMRGSDPDATIYWLAKMLASGEDPEFIARRIIVQAAEDVGLADPTALRVAVSAADAVKYIGMPEARIPLAMAALHVAISPKSNSAYEAIDAAMADVRRGGGASVPDHLSGGHRAGGSDAAYLYPHSYPGGWVRQRYMPEGLQDRIYYRPKNNPRENRIAEHFRQMWDSDREDSDSPEGAGDPEGSVVSPEDSHCEDGKQ